MEIINISAICITGIATAIMAFATWRMGTFNRKLTEETKRANKDTQERWLYEEFKKHTQEISDFYILTKQIDTEIFKMILHMEHSANNIGPIDSDLVIKALEPNDSYPESPISRELQNKCGITKSDIDNTCLTFIKFKRQEPLLSEHITCLQRVREGLLILINESSREVNSNQENLDNILSDIRDKYHTEKESTNKN
jgi:hypothetical protein